MAAGSGLRGAAAAVVVVLLVSGGEQDDDYTACMIARCVHIAFDTEKQTDEHTHTHT